MNQKALDENEILEILELAKVAEQKMKEASEIATGMSEKCQSWYEAMRSVKTK
ncbi:hypothetical protein [Pseudanabaena sp. PCC 6802]|uniref:hypothetical protein n=1 Tax=Pseudanabaena sp. PCC 6802 TaxID=118173 RepID=UPI00034BCB36|nr:hypothetical protein [Pseudanabaena sp. PCC 6802]